MVGLFLFLLLLLLLLLQRYTGCRTGHQKVNLFLQLRQLLAQGLDFPWLCQTRIAFKGLDVRFLPRCYIVASLSVHTGSRMPCAAMTGRLPVAFDLASLTFVTDRSVRQGVIETTADLQTAVGRRTKLLECIWVALRLVKLRNDSTLPG